MCRTTVYKCTIEKKKKETNTKYNNCAENERYNVVHNQLIVCTSDFNK